MKETPAPPLPITSNHALGAPSSPLPLITLWGPLCSPLPTPYSFLSLPLCAVPVLPVSPGFLSDANRRVESNCAAMRFCGRERWAVNVSGAENLPGFGEAYPALFAGDRRQPEGCSFAEAVIIELP